MPKTTNSYWLSSIFFFLWEQGWECWGLYGGWLQISGWQIRAHRAKSAWTQMAQQCNCKPTLPCFLTQELLVVLIVRNQLEPQWHRTQPPMHHLRTVGGTHVHSTKRLQFGPKWHRTQLQPTLLRFFTHNTKSLSNMQLGCEGLNPNGNGSANANARVWSSNFEPKWHRTQPTSQSQDQETSLHAAWLQGSSPDDQIIALRYVQIINCTLLRADNKLHYGTCR